MRGNPEGAYIFCTPFLGEIDRIREACGRDRFKEPLPYTGTKIDNFNDLLTDGQCVAVSHVTFLNATPETLDRIHEGGYTLVLDEVLDVVVEFNNIQSVEDSPGQSIMAKDLDFLIKNEIIKIHPDFRVEWCDSEYGKDFHFSEVERLAKLGVLYCVRKKLLVTIFPPAIFRLFEHVYVLTYMFDGSILKNYFQLFGLDFETASIRKVDGNYVLEEFNDNADYAFRQQFQRLVSLCDSQSLNNGVTRQLSKAWYQKAKDTDMRKLRNDLGTYFNRYLKDAKASNGDIMWTCPVDYEVKLQGQGYTRVRALSKQERKLPEGQRRELEKRLKCFVPCNSKATNIYRDKWALAYCCNMYLHPMIRGFFMDYNDERQRQNLQPIFPDENRYALSCLIQWICRSRIRDGQPISIYIPSKRMRTLLVEWMQK